MNSNAHLVLRHLRGLEAGARPALKEIAEQCGVSVSTVHRAVKLLISRGLVSWAQDVNTGRLLHRGFESVVPAKQVPL